MRFCENAYESTHSTKKVACRRFWENWSCEPPPLMEKNINTTSFVSFRSYISRSNLYFLRGGRVYYYYREPRVPSFKIDKYTFWAKILLILSTSTPAPTQNTSEYETDSVFQSDSSSYTPWLWGIPIY